MCLYSFGRFLGRKEEGIERGIAKLETENGNGRYDGGDVSVTV